eukprot:COSAG06_NODE_112_length_23474_cov_81.804458_1_plen_91_part_10
MVAEINDLRTHVPLAAHASAPCARARAGTNATNTNAQPPRSDPATSGQGWRRTRRPYRVAGGRGRAPPACRAEQGRDSDRSFSGPPLPFFD